MRVARRVSRFAFCVLHVAFSVMRFALCVLHVAFCVSRLAFRVLCQDLEQHRGQDPYQDIHQDLDQVFINI